MTPEVYCSQAPITLASCCLFSLNYTQAHRQLVYPEIVQEPQNYLGCRTSKESWLPVVLYGGSSFASTVFESSVSHNEGAPETATALKRKRRKLQSD